MKIVRMPVGMMGVNCYIVWDEATREAVLIDPAGEEDRILRRVREEGLTVKYIVNTHGHPDHTCGNARVKRETGAPVVMHELDDDFFATPEAASMARMFGFEPAPPADLRIRDGATITFGGLTATFLHTPGHTPGACCLLIDGHLFTGDTLFVGAVGRTDLPGGSMETLLRSLRERVATLPPETRVWPGHDYGERPDSTIGRELRTNPYLTDF